MTSEATQHAIVLHIMRPVLREVLLGAGRPVDVTHWCFLMVWSAWDVLPERKEGTLWEVWLIHSCFTRNHLSWALDRPTAILPFVTAQGRVHQLKQYPIHTPQASYHNNRHTHTHYTCCSALCAVSYSFLIQYTLHRLSNMIARAPVSVVGKLLDSEPGVGSNELSSIIILLLPHACQYLWGVWLGVSHCC